MSIRRRTWTTNTGERREAWVVDYVDQAGARHIETFARRRDADARQAAVKVNVRAGVHSAVSSSPTVAEAAEAWLRHVELEGRERATLKGYREHVRLHINPRIGRVKLASLTTPKINAFRDELLASGSRGLAKKVLTSLKSLLKDAQRRGSVAQNVALGVSIGIDQRGKRVLEAGVHFPTPDEVRRILAAVKPRWRPPLVTAVFSGLRASELRGLRWEDIDLKKGEIHVRQRADRYNTIGRPKSRAGSRTVPLGPMVINTLREWRLRCPANPLAFATRSGKAVHHKNLIRSALIPAQIAAGVVTTAGRAKYTGLHSLRHFYASWCINRRADGGLELPPKLVQARLGHSSIVMTLDTYGHLFPSDDDGAELAAAERVLLTDVPILNSGRNAT
jgi:integrase